MKSRLFWSSFTLSLSIAVSAVDATLDLNPTYYRGKVEDRYYKLDAVGHLLPSQNQDWSCIYDMVTGLVWEGPQHRLRGEMLWNEAAAFPNFLNEKVLCGTTGWRIPKAEELFTQINARQSPATDRWAFPQMAWGGYWTDEPYTQIGFVPWPTFYNQYLTLPTDQRRWLRLVASAPVLKDLRGNFLHID